MIFKNIQVWYDVIVSSPGAVSDGAIREDFDGLVGQHDIVDVGGLLVGEEQVREPDAVHQFGGQDYRALLLREL